MAATDPNNIIDPELLTDYAQAQYFEGIKVVRSGILQDLDIEASSSSSVEMPQWETLGEMQTLAPGAEIVYRDLNDHKEIHPVVRRYNGNENLDLATIISKGDPNVEASRQIATNTARGLNKAAIATLQGCVAANSANVVADTGVAPAALDITKLQAVFGDISEEVLMGNGILVMRSKVYYAYKDLGLIADPTVGDRLQDEIVAGTQFSGFRGSLLGHPIVVDDELFRAGLTSKTTGDALTYLVGIGALKSVIQKDLAVESGRDIDNQSDKLVWSVHRSMGLKGMNFSGTINKQGPNDSDLRSSSNWGLVAEDAKLVPAASIQTNHPA